MSGVTHSGDTLREFRGLGTEDQVLNSVHLRRVFSMTLLSHQMEPDPTTGWWVGSAVFSTSLEAGSTPDCNHPPLLQDGG